MYWQEGETLHQWGNSSVRAVLNRHNYYGDLVQRKYESRFAKGEKGCDVLDESQWIVTPNAHEAIISRELFEKVQIRLKAAQEARSTGVGWEDDERAFYNVFYCGDCKRKMCTRRSRGSVFYFCNAAQYRDERKCSHIFSAKILEIQNEIKKLDAEVEQRSEKLAQAFMQYKDEKLSKENYMEMREERNNWKMFCEERKETLEQTGNQFSI